MIELTEAEFRELDENHGGICVSCHNRQDGCEPDARNYECESCGEEAVFGVSELLLDGQLELTEEAS